MKALEARHIAEACGAALVAGSPSALCSSCAVDSRKIGEGGLYVAFPGERVDGNDFCMAAFDAGAAAVAMCADAPAELVAFAEQQGRAIIRVADDDPEEFLLRLAEHVRDLNPQWAVVGVTGSVGKTTTKDMLAAGLSSRWRTHATKGNFNNLIGLPLTLLAAPEDAEVIVCEMGMNHAGEIDRLTRIARPALALITNVGTSHIGFLGSRENIARAKAEIVAGMEPAALPDGRELEPTLFLPSSDDFCAFIRDGFAEPAGIACELVGQHEGDDVRYFLGEADTHGRHPIRVSALGAEAQVTVPVAGKHAALDFALAFGVCCAMGCDASSAASAIQDMPATSMRLEIIDEDGKPTVIDDSYNAAPASMASALDVLAAFPCDGKRVAVLGEMGEMGDEAGRMHDIVGAYAAAKGLDLVAFVGSELADRMREAAIACGASDDSIERFDTPESAAAVLGPVLSENDVVLAKGSRAAGLDIFVKEVLDR